MLVVAYVLGKICEKKTLDEVRRGRRMKFSFGEPRFFSSFLPSARRGSTREFSNDKSDSKDTVVLECVKTNLKK